MKWSKSAALLSVLVLIVTCDLSDGAEHGEPPFTQNLSRGGWPSYAAAAGSSSSGAVPLVRSPSRPVSPAQRMSLSVPELNYIIFQQSEQQQMQSQYGQQRQSQQQAPGHAGLHSRWRSGGSSSRETGEEGHSVSHGNGRGSGSGNHRSLAVASRTAASALAYPPLPTVAGRRLRRTDADTIVAGGSGSGSGSGSSGLVVILNRNLPHHAHMSESDQRLRAAQLGSIHRRVLPGPPGPFVQLEAESALVQGGRQGEDETESAGDLESVVSQPESQEQLQPQQAQSSRSRRRSSSPPPRASQLPRQRQRQRSQHRGQSPLPPSSAQLRPPPTLSSRINWAELLGDDEDDDGDLPEIIAESSEAGEEDTENSDAENAEHDYPEGDEDDDGENMVDDDEERRYNENDDDDDEERRYNENNDDDDDDGDLEDTEVEDVVDIYLAAVAAQTDGRRQPLASSARNAEMIYAHILRRTLHLSGIQELEREESRKDEARHTMELDGRKRLGWTVTVAAEHLGSDAERAAPFCSICRDEYAEDAPERPVVRLPCKHHMHLDCAEKWLYEMADKASCAMCRGKV